MFINLSFDAEISFSISDSSCLFSFLYFFSIIKKITKINKRTIQPILTPIYIPFFLLVLQTNVVEKEFELVNSNENVNLLDNENESVFVK